MCFPTTKYNNVSWKIHLRVRVQIWPLNVRQKYPDLWWIQDIKAELMFGTTD